MTDHELARLLLGARAGTPIPTGPSPADAAQAYRVQALVMAELGEIGGWKVGAAGPNGPISCAPLPARWLFEATARLDAAVFTQREVESEICFRLAADLPSRGTSYTQGDVLAAVASCHPGIEVLQSRYAQPDSAGPLALLADFIQTGAFVVGAPIEGWRELDFDRLQVCQTVGDGPERRATGNPAGGMARLMAWLANEGAAWAGGLRAGQVVTCGSWTGRTRVAAPGLATTLFDGAAPVSVAFG